MLQVNELVDLKTFCDNPKNAKGHTFRTQAERRKFVKEKLGLKILKDPMSGADAVPVHNKTLMLSGHRRAATRSKEEEHDSNNDAKESFAKAREGLTVKGNAKAGFNMLSDVPVVQCNHENCQVLSCELGQFLPISSFLRSSCGKGKDFNGAVLFMFRVTS